MGAQREASNMKEFLVYPTAILITIMLLGCAQKDISFALAPSNTAPVVKAGRADLSAEKQSVVRQDSIKPLSPKLNEKVSDIYFALNKHDLDDKAKETIRRHAAKLREMNSRIVIKGNCGATGTREYSLALAERMVNAAKKLLISLGVPSAKIDTFSYGQDKPVCNENIKDCGSNNGQNYFVLVVRGK